MGHDMMEGAQYLAIIYRLCYKVMKTTLDPRSKVRPHSGETLLLTTSNEFSNITIPRMIKWDDVVLPDDWK